MPLGSDLLLQLKEAAIKLARQEVVSYHVGQLPFLGFALVKPILGFVVGVVIETLIKHTVLGAKFVQIDLSTVEDANRFAQAAYKNQEVQAQGTAAQKKASENEVIEAARRLLVFDL